MNIINFDIYAKELSGLNFGKRLIVNTINPHSYITSKKDSLFKKALKDSDILLADGEGIVLAARILNKEKIKKTSGYDLHKFLLNDLNKKNSSCFYLGASKETLKLIKEKNNLEFPNIRVDCYSPPYKNIFNDEDNEIMINKVNKFNPDVLFVGMTAPKQEKWVYQNKDKLNANIICSIGAVFDFYAGTVQRVNKIWIDLHLEWFRRFLNEPGRLWRRNFISSPLFILEILLFKLKIRKDFFNGK
jgi:N-acetylglucosaminyldiphosphoundecaprenol N-acetyl-beta-D-mannosaminyltransferase